MNDTKVVYVTGCLGFIGSYITEQCLSNGWRVRGIDKITYAASPELIQKWRKNYGNLFEFDQNIQHIRQYYKYSKYFQF